MKDSSNYALVVNGVRFSFREENQLRGMLGSMFSYCEDRGELYHFIVGDNMDYVLGSTLAGDASDHHISHLRAVKVLRDMYGDIFDPDKIAFDLLEDSQNSIV